MTNAEPDRDFIRTLVANDVASGKYGRPVATRFPPEPNGYLHIGHAKSVCLNFGVAAEFGGTCNVRFDDTNPTTEDVRYAEAILQDVRWLGFDPGDRIFYASDYFEELYRCAVTLIEAGKAYVDSLSEGEIREYRGTVTEAGRDSPYRNRSVEENLDLFARMRSGEFPDGAHVLRARIDMASANMLMRDPLLYRIRHAHHYRHGDRWCIYPMYDFAHCLSDSFERITHSLCTLEFKDNRALYDWVIRETGVEAKPEQTEFARLNLEYTVLSKRKLIRLVSEGHVEGWDDPRMPTLAGLRRRGVTPEAIRRFCDLIGVARVDSRVDLAKFEYCLRDDLNMRVPRVMCVLRPIKLVITNYPEGQTETLDVPSYPHDVPLEGSRKVPFSRDLYIEREDFMEAPPDGYYRLAPGREVRLRYAYYVTCTGVVRDPKSGEVQEVHCTYDPETRGGQSKDGRKVRGTLHWVDAEASLPAEVRLYDRLFDVADPESGAEDFTTHLNPNSLVTLTESRIEPSVGSAAPGSRYQFERQGYFVSDAADSSAKRPVLNRTIALRDSWARETPAATVRTGSERRPRVIAPDTAPRSVERTADAEARFSRYVGDLGLTEGDADTLARIEGIDAFFASAVAAYREARTVANWTVNELLGFLDGRLVAECGLTPSAFADLIRMVDEKTISRTVAKEILGELVERGGDPGRIVAERNLHQLDDRETIRSLASRVVAANPDKVEQFKAGRTGLAGFFVGQVMRESGGKADPLLVKEVVDEALR